MLLKASVVRCNPAPSCRASMEAWGGVFVYNCRQNARASSPNAARRPGDDMLDLSTLGTFVAVVFGLFLIPG
ncbi:MAG TPA: hypothetical protein VGM85_17890, partial [Paraburkholderia sp.]